MQARKTSEVGPTKLEVRSTEEYKQGGAPVHLLSLTQAGFSKREKQQRTKKEEVVVVWVYTTLVEFYTEEVLQGFLPCGFPEENIYVLVLLCSCVCCSFSDLLVDNC